MGEIGTGTDVLRDCRQRRDMRHRCAVSPRWRLVSSPNTSKVSFCMTAPLLLPLSVEAIQPREARFGINEQAGTCAVWMVDQSCESCERSAKEGAGGVAVTRGRRSEREWARSL